MTPTPADHSDLSALAAVAREVASTVVRLSSDIALLIGDDGVIRSVSEGQTPLSPGSATWVGRAWVDTVTGDTRRKVELLLDEARTAGFARRREVNHPSSGGPDIPVAYSAVRLGAHGPVLAVGRDLRAVAAIQQRFLDAQQEMERDYWQRRQAETRYRLLLQVLNDAVLVLEATTLNVIEANPAAHELFAPSGDALIGRSMGGVVGAASRAALDEMLLAARTTGRAAEIRVRTATPHQTLDISATPLRSEGQQWLLVRARNAHPTPLAADDAPAFADFVERTPDAVVITDSAGRVQMANPAFHTLCGVGGEAAVRGRPIAEVMGDTQHQWADLLGKARSRGVVGRATVTVRVPGTPALTVDISAALLAEGEQECIGFNLRPVATVRRVTEVTFPELAPGLGELAAQVGRVSLAELLEQAQFVTEKHLVLRALQLARNSTVKAADLLGISSAELVSRLQRLGLAMQDGSSSLRPN